MHDRLLADIRRNRHNAAILDRWPALGLRDGWLVAGCLFQTVWNLRDGRAAESSIKDYDLFYFDADDLGAAAEQRVQAHIQRVLHDLDIVVEVCNQARVHLWYAQEFGAPYGALASACDGIDRFLVPATCVGVRPGACHAPHGLQLLYDGVLTPNPLLGDTAQQRLLFDRKVASYRQRWPWLTRQAGWADTAVNVTADTSPDNAADEPAGERDPRAAAMPHVCPD